MHLYNLRMYLLVLIIMQYQLEMMDIPQCTLWVCLWDWIKHGQDNFLGEIKIPLSDLDLEDTSGNWYNLQEQV